MYLSYEREGGFANTFISTSIIIYNKEGQTILQISVLEPQNHYKKIDKRKENTHVQNILVQYNKMLNFKYKYCFKKFIMFT